MRRQKLLVVIGAILALVAVIVALWFFDLLPFGKEAPESSEELIAEGESSKFGFLSDRGINDDFEFWAGLGIFWDRAAPSPVWGEVEPAPGEFNFSNIDQYVKNVQTRGIRTLFILWPFAAWDQKKCYKSRGGSGSFPDNAGGMLAIPCDWEAYESFVEKVVERYDGDGQEDMVGLEYPIRHFEIGNELENHSPESEAFQITPQGCVDLLKHSYQAVKKANPDAEVLHGGLASAYEYPRKWWGEVFGLGGGEYFDIANIHSINGEEDLNTGGFKKLLAKYGLAGKPIWVTEAQVNAGSGKGFKDRSYEDQAELLKTGVSQAFANGVEKIFFVLNIRPVKGLTLPTLMDEGGNRLPIYSVVENLINEYSEY